MKLLILLFAALGAVSAKPLVCYYGSWSVYRTGVGHFTVEDIDPNLCTHLIYTFIGLNTDGTVKVLDAWNDVGDDWHEGAFTKIHRLMDVNKDLKVLLAVGGWNHGPYPFQVVVESPALRTAFVNNAVDMIKLYGFHGLDLDWEYQDAIGGTQAQKDGFSALLREFRTRFDQEGMILSAALAAGFSLIDANYDVPVLSETCDFLNVMAYDLHGPWEPYTGHVAPIDAMASETGTNRNLNVRAVLEKYIKMGANPAKINLGFVTYGHTFTLADPANSGVYAPSTGKGEMGQWIPEAGSYAYGEYCINKNSWQYHFIDEQGVPYAVNGNQWLGFDDEKAVDNKLALMRELNIGGAMVWSIETDDFAGLYCGQGKYPIINHIKNGL